MAPRNAESFKTKLEQIYFKLYWKLIVIACTSPCQTNGIKSRGVPQGISGWECAAGTLEPLAFTRASFSWILLPYTRVNSPNHSYPRVLPVTKNSPKRALTLSLDSSFRFSTPNPGRVAAGVASYMLRHSKYVRTHYQYKSFNFNQY